jgi:predicted ATPase
LPPLRLPPPNPELTPDDIRAFPAIQFFLERADETFDDLRITDSRVLTIAEVCRQLDGIPLANELAAVRVRLLGFEGLRSLVNDNFLHFHQGHRTGPQRHQTLAATFEWSFDLLPENERSAFLRLSTLNSSFGLERALSVASGGVMSLAETTACVANLVSKSMIERLPHGESTFRLLHLVRSYGSNKLLSNSNGEENERYHEPLPEFDWTGLSTENSGSPLPARAA